MTGSPGCGKTTVAAQLAQTSPRGLHVPADVFWTFPSYPISPYRAESHNQNVDIVVALMRTATTFATRGYDVILDGIFGPWFLPVVAIEAQQAAVAVDYVVLAVPLEVALRRVRTRESHDGRDHVVRQMHAEFSKLGPYRDHVIDTGDLTPEQVVAEFTSRRSSGIFALDFVRVASKSTV